MKIAFWLMFCAHVMSRSRALDCEDSECLNTLCPLMKSPFYGRNMFKCPHDNYCVEPRSDGDETNACEYCPQGGNETVCSEACNEKWYLTSCDSNVTKCYDNEHSHCDGVENCPNKSDEKECSSNNYNYDYNYYDDDINPACKLSLIHI